MAFYLALREVDVPAEFHVFQKGPHGVGLDLGDPASVSRQPCSSIGSAAWGFWNGEDQVSGARFQVSRSMRARCQVSDARCRTVTSVSSPSVELAESMPGTLGPIDRLPVFAYARRDNYKGNFGFRGTGFQLSEPCECGHGTSAKSRLTAEL